MPKVAIMGGGVAGLSAAHELAERGFAVEIYEKTDRFGGKARSIEAPGTGTAGRRDLPGEHGFRFFPGFYKHVTDTMARIPVAGRSGGVLASLVELDRAALARDSLPLFEFPTRLPRTCRDLRLLFQDVAAMPGLGLSLKDLSYFTFKLVDFMTYCEERRLAELEGLNWWRYVDAANRSPQFQKLLAIGLTRSLVAMKAEIASTRTIATILTQMIVSMMSGESRTMDRVLAGPTSDVWIDPWVRYLRGRGVSFFPGKSVARLDLAADGRISGILFADHSVATADHYVAAVPVEVMQILLDGRDDLTSTAPSLANLSALTVEWMNGIQFYLKRNVPLVRGHAICSDSAWALTIISQPQFWPGIDLSDYGDGVVKGIISVDISNWEAPGTKSTAKAAQDCTEHEIAAEAWAQLTAHFNASADPRMPDEILRDEDQLGWLLDPDIVCATEQARRHGAVHAATGPMGGGSLRGLRYVAALKGAAAALQASNKNLEPLLINTAGSWQHRPDAVTGIPNLFLAADYVRTTTDLATMEGANEAARRAVNGILAASGSSALRCRLFPFEEPPELDTLKRWDKRRFDRGKPHFPLAPWKGLVLAGGPR